MNAKPAPVPKSPEEVAREKLRDNLSLLSAEAFSTSAVVCTHGGTLTLVQATSVNKIIVMAIENVQAIRETLDKPQSPAPAEKDGS